MLFKDGRLGCFGNNDNGQLGIDAKKYSQSKNDLIIYTPEIPLMEKFDIWDIAAGDNYSLLIIGKNLHSMLVRFGYMNADRDVNDKNICGSQSATNIIAQSAPGTQPNVPILTSLHSNPNNNYFDGNDSNSNMNSGFINGDLLGEEHCVNLDNNAISIVDLDYENVSNFAKIFAFGERSMILTGSNEIYVGGMDFRRNRIDDFYLVDHFETNIKSIAIGLDHCLILDIDGHLYGIGDGSLGQLGPRRPVNADKPFRILKNYFDHKIIKIACGLNHSLVLLENGDVYEFGEEYSRKQNDDKRVGNEKPMLVDFGVKGGSNNVNEQNSPSPPEDSCFSSQNNSPYQQHVKQNNSSVSDVGVNDKKIIDIYSGYNHNVAVAESGEIYAWGDMNNDKLGTKREKGRNYLFKPTEMSTMKGRYASNIALGEEMTTIISTSFHGSLFSASKSTLV